MSFEEGFQPVEKYFYNKSSREKNKPGLVCKTEAGIADAELEDCIRRSVSHCYPNAAERDFFLGAIYFDQIWTDENPDDGHRSKTTIELSKQKVFETVLFPLGSRAGGNVKEISNILILRIGIRAHAAADALRSHIAVAMTNFWEQNPQEDGLRRKVISVQTADDREFRNYCIEGRRTSCDHEGWYLGKRGFVKQATRETSFKIAYSKTFEYFGGNKAKGVFFDEESF